MWSTFLLRANTCTEDVHDKLVETAIRYVSIVLSTTNNRRVSQILPPPTVFRRRFRFAWRPFSRVPTISTSKRDFTMSLHVKRTRGTLSSGLRNSSGLGSLTSRPSKSWTAMPPSRWFYHGLECCVKNRFRVHIVLPRYRRPSPVCAAVILFSKTFILDVPRRRRGSRSW